MRILHIVDTLDQHPGLFSITLPGMLAALRDMGFAADVAAGASHDDWELAGLAADSVVVVDEEDPNAALLDLTPLLYALKPLGLRCDLVHIHAPDTEIAKIVVAAARGAGVPFIVSSGGAWVHDSTERGRVSLWLENRRLNKKFADAARLVCVSDAEIAALRQRGIDMPFSVLPIGYTLPTAPPVAGTMPLPWRDGRRTMAYFGDIDGRSGLVELFEMCTRAGERLADWRLVLVGRPVEHWLDHFRRLAEAPEFSLAVDFVVYPEPDHQAAVLAEAQLVVQPHLTPTPGVAALWALAQDKPVLLTAATPAARALETSQLVAPATPEGVRDRLVELIDLPPDDLRGLGVQAGAAIRAACAWSACIPAYAALYTSVGQRPAPSK